MKVKNLHDGNPKLIQQLLQLGPRIHLGVHFWGTPSSKNVGRREMNLH